MTNSTDSTQSNLVKFQRLLRDLFQFDCADLDFGIYRIMNHKRDAIERFVYEALPVRISDELNKGHFALQSQATEKLKEARAKLEAALGKEAVDADGELDARYSATPLGESYLAAKAAVLPGRSQKVVETEIYNHLYTFFRRYYQDGDFNSRRRYSRTERYAIPYNGEEVYLHWANSDQYYVKTAEHFFNYDWASPSGVSVRFRLEAANVEQDNIKGAKRFFVPLFKKVDWDSDGRAVTIPFEYRPLTGEEGDHYGKPNQQDRIIADAVDEIPQRVHDELEAFEALTGMHLRRGNDASVSRLEHHLRKYIRRNDSDFFIHKDLRGFLSRELDFYLKNEVLNLDNLDASGEQALDGWFQKMQLIKSIGTEIIEFLAQIEGFQKMIWEKCKFIVDTQYCITVGSLVPDLYPEIVGNEAQWEEWREYLEIEETDKSRKFLEAHPTLPLDTRHFGADFTDRLLASFDNLDSMTDGILVQSENWQALRLLERKFRNNVQCLYIDPPYNTGDSEILYRNGYLRSSWLTLIENRFSMAMPLLANDPTSYIAIDDFEMVDLCELVDNHFPSLRREMIVVNHHPQGGKATTLSTTHEYMLACVNRTSTRTLVGRLDEEDVERRSFKRSGTAPSNFRYARPNSFYAILVDKSTNEVVGLEPPPDGETGDYPIGDTSEGYVRVYPLGTNGEERVWRRSYESCQLLYRSGKLECSAKGSIRQLITAEEKTPALFSNWIGSRYNAGTHGATLLADIMGSHNPFPYPKSVHTVGDAIFAASVESGGYCLDFFAGSGTTAHAVINLNREDGGQRKFILVEMGEHFDKVLLPRLKRVIFSPEWKDGRPQRTATTEEAKRSPRIVKYMRLESYEDALDSIVFEEDFGQMALAMGEDSFLLKYMLTWETKGSATLLNAEKLANPFSYRLKVHVHGERQERIVDAAETFNYLLGLNVRQRKVFMDSGRRYLVYRGETRERPGHSVAVIWRETKGWTDTDFARDRDFVDVEGMAANAETVYVNGDSVISGAKAIEPLFKELILAGVRQ